MRILISAKYLFSELTIIDNGLKDNVYVSLYGGALFISTDSSHTSIECHVVRPSNEIFKHDISKWLSLKDILNFIPEQPLTLGINERGIELKFEL